MTVFAKTRKSANPTEVRTAELAGDPGETRYTVRHRGFGGSVTLVSCCHEIQSNWQIWQQHTVEMGTLRHAAVFAVDMIRDEIRYVWKFIQQKSQVTCILLLEVLCYELVWPDPGQLWTRKSYIYLS